MATMTPPQHDLVGFTVWPRGVPADRPRANSSQIPQREKKDGAGEFMSHGVKRGKPRDGLEPGRTAAWKERS